MKSSKLRTIVAAVVFVVLSVGLCLGIGFGTLSGFGWESISLLCPVGALTSMIASKTFIPRAIISLLVMGVLVFLVGRAFCGWICPVPLWGKILAFFRSPKKRNELKEQRRKEVLDISKRELACGHNCSSCSSSCASAHKKFDSRHYVLAGGLLSAAIFGFPVFCLVCPVGLSFATVLLVWRLFAAGDVTLLVLIVPAILVIELVFLRKWCARFCPLAALMNLVSRFSKTFVPVIDDSLCIESTSGKPCSRCAEVCEAGINLRHLDFGEKPLADCTRCRACVEACPKSAIKMPFLKQNKDVVVRHEVDENS